MEIVVIKEIDTKNRWWVLLLNRSTIINYFFVSLSFQMVEMHKSLNGENSNSHLTSLK